MKKRALQFASLSVSAGHVPLNLIRLPVAEEHRTLLPADWSPLCVVQQEVRECWMNSL